MFFYEVKANNENTRQHFYDKRIINKECKYRVNKIFLKMTRRSSDLSCLVGNQPEIFQRWQVSSLLWCLVKTIYLLSSALGLFNYQSNKVNDHTKLKYANSRRVLHLQPDSRIWPSYRKNKEYNCVKLKTAVKGESLGNETKTRTVEGKRLRSASTQGNLLIQRILGRVQAQFKYGIRGADILFPGLSLTVDSDGLTVNAPSLVRSYDQMKKKYV